jgi:SAM-dependent methyltransferase
LSARPKKKAVPKRAAPRAKSKPTPVAASNGKVYDEAYFDRWYRDPRHSVIHLDVLARRVQLALSAAEYILEHPVKSVLDVGCGEGPWRDLIMRARPGATYRGIDSSEYAVRKFGKRRNISLGRFGDVGRIKHKDLYDLIVCSDVLHYVPTPEARRGLKAIARVLGGLAFIEIFTKEDDTFGDDDGFIPRSEATYRTLFREAGLVHLGLHCYTSRRFAADLMTFEKGKGSA